MKKKRKQQKEKGAANETPHFYRALAHATQVVELPDHTRIVVLVPEDKSQPVLDAKEAKSYPAESLLKVEGDREYDVQRVVAKGGMGIICEAMDLRCDRIVAMKFLMKGKEQHEEDHLRFVLEAKVTAQLEHPNIVPVHEVGNDTEGNDFYTMKYVRGVTLTEVLTDIRKGCRETIEKYRMSDLLTVFQKTCDAVAFSHSRGVIHRDLKPGNIMIGDFGEVLVLDWGLAKTVGVRGEGGKGGGKKGASEGQHSVEDPLVIEGEEEIPTISIQTDKLGGGLRSESGKIIGTPSFMSPEHARGGGAAVDARSDVYSLGAILYSILTLRVPVKGTTIKEVLNKIVSGDILPPVAYNETSQACEVTEKRIPLLHCPDGQVAPVLSEIAMQALATDPAHRYQSVKELQADVEAYQNGHIWHMIIDEDFSDPELFKSRWRVVGGHCEIRDGECVMHGGEPQMLLLRRDLAGDVRIEFECREEGTYLNDIGCLAAGVPLERSWDTSISGYAFKYGGYTNSFNVLTRLDRKLWSEEQSPIVAGKTYKVRVERVEGRLSMMVNKEEVFSVVDPEPLTGSHRALVGLLGWIAEMHYSHVRIYSLGAPWQSDVLEIAERHLQKGNYSTAIDLFDEILDSLPDAQRMQRAKKGQEVALDRNHMLQQLPTWREQLHEAWPDVRIILKIDVRGLVAEIPAADITDLSALKEMPFSVLSFPRNKVVSLDPLREMSLTSLDCSANRVESLEPLKGMALTRLNCSVNRIASLAPLRGMPLTWLNCGDNGLEDGLEALRGMPLTWFNCGRCGLRNVDALSGMPLVMLFCEVNKLTDLDALRGLKLNELSCCRNSVVNLGPLEGMPLNDLNCAYNRVESLEPLGNMPLSTLKCQGNVIKNLEPIVGMPLSTLLCGANELRGVGPLIKNPPKNFLFDCDSIGSDELQWILQRWSRDFRCADHARHVEVMLALRAMDAKRLRGLASEFEGCRYLFVPRFLAWEEAKDVCEKLGGHLVTITSEAENEFVASLIPYGAIWFWLGLITVKKDPEWVTGEPVAFNAFLDEFHAWTPGPKIFRGKNWFYEPIPDALNCFVMEWEE